MKKYVFFGLMFLFLFGCQQNDPVGVEADQVQSDVEQWSEQEVIDFLAKMEYPEDRSLYKRQFFNGYHRSQLTPQQLSAAEVSVSGRDLAKVVGGGGMNTINTVSTYFFYFTHTNYRDEDVYEDANSIYGDMVYEYSDDWDTNTDYMDVTADVIDCHDYLLEYADRSDFSDLESSSSSNSTCAQGSAYDFDIFSPWLYAKPVAGNNMIMAVPPAYVFADLNPGVEDWTSGFPDAWQITLLAAYQIPSHWYSHFLTSRATQSTNEYSGTYAIAINASRGNGRAISTGYFELPTGAEAGVYDVTIAFGGNSQFLTYNLEAAMFDDSDDIIGTYVAGVCTTGASGAYALNEISINTGATEPKYFRAAVYLDIGQNTNIVYVDHLTLSGPEGDISLPVTYYPAINNLGADHVGGSSETCLATWSTTAEVDNAYWALFTEHDGYRERFSEDNESGMGTKATTTNYSRTFDIKDWAYDEMKYESGEIDVYLGCVNYDGVWEYFTDDVETMVYIP